MAKISIIILSWNTKKLLQSCLNSLKFAIEIIVVDNGSTDGSPEMVKNKFSQIKLIRNRKNLGFAKGNNQGIRAARGNLIMLLNSDTVVKKGAIKKLVTSINQSDQIAAISPLLLLPGGNPQIDYYMKFPNLWQIFFYHNRIIRPIALKLPFLRNLICFAPKKKTFEVDQLPGAALMATREVWDKIGLLDEDYKFLYEDVDWCWRARKLGYKLMVVPDAKIVHLGGASWKRKLKEDGFEFYRQFFSSMLLFVKKNYGDWRLRLFRTALAINFLFTLKFKLAVYFLKTAGRQEARWR